jgi:hypothetical protein
MQYRHPMHLSARQITGPSFVLNIALVRQAAAHAGAAFLGLRPWQNVPGSPFQRLIGEPAILREVQAAMADTGVRVLDLEIIRIDAGFDARRLTPLFELGAALGARSVTVAGDDTDAARLCDSYARVC